MKLFGKFANQLLLPPDKLLTNNLKNRASLPQALQKLALKCVKYYFGFPIPSKMLKEGGKSQLHHIPLCKVNPLE
ncbi:hypothetical protein IEQ34_003109 [Dendrobium chrysotoxum]|uniref:Uncharacterized protein n=1 Tax=Dendrobium chrysotoxum TaxID=161865 RepID=A0AAV7HG88_DENCH|nr:hypothetical protein IEQ34_003109 [Dendrobium chrysotoxum]